jgi:hypothetical protein
LFHDENAPLEKCPSCIVFLRFLIGNKQWKDSLEIAVVQDLRGDICEEKLQKRPIVTLGA